MSANNLSYLQLRLRHLNHDGALDTADAARTAILSSLAANAYCGLFRTPKGLRGLTFSEAFALVFGEELETRERKARKRA